MAVSEHAADHGFMELAIQEARRALEKDEVPIGAVLVKEATVLAAGHNETRTLQDPTAHAEILALRKAATRLANYRLLDTTMYVTVEPCIMCAGALLHARVKRLVYGARDPKWGAMGSCYSLHSDPRLNHAINVTGNVLVEPCRELMQSFFQKKRDAKVHRQCGNRKQT